MDDAPARQTVRDELGVALQALIDQERVVVGDGLVERQGRLDAVLVQHGEDAKDPDAVAVLVVAVAADVGKLPAGLPLHRPSGPPIGLTGSGVPAGTSQSQCSRLTMTARATRALSGHLRTGRVTIGDQG